MTRNVGRSLILAAVMLGASLAAAACSAREPAAPAVDINAPHATSPAFVTEPLSIRTAGGRRDFQVEIADVESERQHGLMFRTSLPPMHGMLFQFEQEAPRSFWMKNTYIPLDIIYIAADGTIVSIAAMTEPFSEAPIPSAGPALGVLEIYGGQAAALGVKPGDKVEHRIFAQ